MNHTTYMQRFALALTAVGCMAVPVQGLLAQSAPQQTQLASSDAPAVPAYSTSTAVDAPVAAAQDGQAPSAFGQPAPAAPQNHSYWHTHGFDLAGSINGRLQQPITDETPVLAGQTLNAGFLGTIREHPVSWAGIEFDYGYNKYTEHYRTLPAGGVVSYVPIQQHEATAGYVIHIKTPWVQPFVVLGGGGINFRSSRIQPPQGSGFNGDYGNQWRGTYMANVGFDLTSKRAKNFGMRIQEHSLFYKAPDFYQAGFRSNAWVHQALPSIGFFYRF